MAEPGFTAMGGDLILGLAEIERFRERCFVSAAEATEIRAQGRLP